MAKRKGKKNNGKLQPTYSKGSRHTLYKIIFEHNTKEGKAFDIWLIIAIMASVFLKDFRSSPPPHRRAPREPSALVTALMKTGFRVPAHDYLQLRDLSLLQELSGQIGGAGKARLGAGSLDADGRDVIRPSDGLG